MTKLEAVNEMLEAIGIPAVTALDTGGTTEEAEAEVILDRWTDRVLAKGWNCNTADEKTLTPSGATISLTGYYSFSGGKYGDDYAIKDGILYDPVNDTIAFTESVTLLDVVFSLTFTQIPDHIADLIVAEAKLALVRFKRQDTEMVRLYAAERNEARAHAKAVDARLMSINVTRNAEAHFARGFPHGQR